MTRPPLPARMRLGLLIRRLPHAFSNRVLRSRRGRASATNLFHRAYYEARDTWEDARWLGARALKTPQDLWVYQEILHETSPDLIIETGTFEGGSALYLATVCDALGRGRVLSIDVSRPTALPGHDRLEFLEGSSTDPEILARVRERIDDDDRVMVLLDSDHSREHVGAELSAYGALVTPGCYLVVEDTNINGHPVAAHWGEGPAEALRDFLAAGAPYVVDRSREKFLLTFNPGGFLKRV